MIQTETDLEVLSRVPLRDLMYPAFDPKCILPNFARQLSLTFRLGLVLHVDQVAKQCRMARLNLR